MGKGPKGPAGEQKKRQRHGRTSAPFESVAEEHDGTMRAVKQRRSGNRFRFRRKSWEPRHPRTDSDKFYASFIAALWVMLVAAGMSTPIGNTASGTDTGSGWTPVRTAVEVGFPGSIPSTASRATFLLPITLDLNAIHLDLRRAYTTSCALRSWPATVHARGQRRPQLWRLYIRSNQLESSPLGMRLSLPTAYLLLSGPPVTYGQPPARLDRSIHDCSPVHLRPAVSPACRPNCFGSRTWTRPLLHRAARLRHANRPCHPVPHGTTYFFQKPRKEYSEKNQGLFRVLVSSQRTPVTLQEELRKSTPTLRA